MLLANLACRGDDLVERAGFAPKNRRDLVRVGLDHCRPRAKALREQFARRIKDDGFSRLADDGDELGVYGISGAFWRTAVNGHDFACGGKLANLPLDGRDVVFGDLAPGLEELRRGAVGVKHVDAAARLVGDGHEVVADAVRVEQVAQELSVVPAHEARRDDVLPTGRHRAARVEALAAGRVVGVGDAHDRPHLKPLIDAVRLVDGCVERDSGNHGRPFSTLGLENGCAREGVIRQRDGWSPRGPRV